MVKLCALCSLSFHTCHTWSHAVFVTLRWWSCQQCAAHLLTPTVEHQLLSLVILYQVLDRCKTLHRTKHLFSSICYKSACTLHDLYCNIWTLLCISVGCQSTARVGGWMAGYINITNKGTRSCNQQFSDKVMTPYCHLYVNISVELGMI